MSLEYFEKGMLLKEVENLKSQREMQKLATNHDLRRAEKEEEHKRELELQDRQFNLQQQQKKEELLLKEQVNFESEKEITHRTLKIQEKQLKHEAKLEEAKYRSESELKKLDHTHSGELKNLDHTHSRELKNLDYTKDKELTILNHQQEIRVLQEKGIQNQREANFKLKSEVLIKQLDESLYEQRIQAERFNTNALEEARHTRELESKNADLRAMMVTTLAEMAKAKVINELEKDRFEHQQKTLLKMRILDKELGLTEKSVSPEEVAEMVSEFQQEQDNSYK